MKDHPVGDNFQWEKKGEEKSVEVMQFKKLPTVKFKEWKENAESLIMKILKNDKYRSNVCCHHEENMTNVANKHTQKRIPPFLGVGLPKNRQVEMMQIPLLQSREPSAVWVLLKKRPRVLKALQVK